MDGGFGQNEVEPPIEPGFRDSIEQLERIGESYADRVIVQSADETIIIAPATTKALAVESESHAGNAYDDWSEAPSLERVRRLRWLEDSVGAAVKLGEIANAPGNDRARGRGRLDPRIEDRTAGAQ